MIKPYFDRRVEKHSLSGAKPRLFKEVYREMAKSDGQFIFLSFLKSILKINVRHIFKLLAILLLMAVIGFWVLNKVYPLTINVDYATIITDKDDEIIHAYLSNDDKWRMKTELHEISSTLKKAIVHREDKYFYWHFGVNPLAIVRAIFKNIVSGKRTSGASTITMQVARLLKPKPRTYKNKLI